MPMLLRHIRVLTFASNICIAAFLGLFVYINLQSFLQTGNWGYPLIALNEGTYAFFFLIRSTPVATSASVSDWAVAFVGTFLSTLVRPAEPLSVVLGDTLITLGTLCNIGSVLSLGRSLAIVPSQRRIKTGGLYRYVRHPMYASAITAQLGYLIANISLLNIVLTALVGTFLVMRLQREERFLLSSEAYRRYAARTPYRLVPHVY